MAAENGLCAFSLRAGKRVNGGMGVLGDDAMTMLMAVSQFLIGAFLLRTFLYHLVL
jgi:hypothetical protein